MAKRSIQNATCSASVMDRGATITSWHPSHAHEALFVSSSAHEDDFEFHGGIPLCAPWFGTGRDGDAPHKHGLVRLADWRFVSGKQLGDATQMVWELAQTDVAHLPGAERYPDDLVYRCTATFGARLDLDLTISSPTRDAVIDAAFHTYFLVNNVMQAEVRGATPEPLRFEGAHDGVNPGVLDDGGPISIVLPDRIIDVEGRGARDVVVWNPGPTPPEGQQQLASDWRRMLCVEIGNVRDHAVGVPAGGTLEMGMTIRIQSRGRIDQVSANSR